MNERDTTTEYPLHDVMAQIIAAATEEHPMSEIRILEPSDFDALPRIFADAYPGIKIVSEEDRQRLKQRALKLHMEEPTAHFHGLFRHGELLGTMCFYDFTMNFLGARIPAGGVGQVAVDLVHKKEHVAKEMMRYFLQHFRQRGTPLVTLYPFRPDFYRKMGFGYGTKMNQYRVRPASLPRGPSKANIRYLGEHDKGALKDCYQRFATRTHGMMDKTEREVQRLFGNPAHRIVGCEVDGQVQGYLVFTFAQGESFITNDLIIHEFICENREAMSELLTFLHTQADQIRYVIVNTQDEYFHHLLLDPRNQSERLIPDVYHETNVQGVGLMYRVVDVPRIFDLLSKRDFGTPEFGAQTGTLKLTVDDSFLPENAGSLLLQFEGGHLQRLDRGNYDAELHLDIADLSSLLAGTVDFRSLYRYGLAEISSSKYAAIVDRIFAVAQKPMCTTSF
jgi:predicted acetyltransferase